MTQAALMLDDNDEIELDGSELTAALRAVPKTGKNWSKAEVVLHFEAGEAVFTIPGMTLRVPAQGSLRGQVRFPMPFLQRLAAYPPKSDPVKLSASADRLKIDGATVTCVRDVGRSPTISLPINPTLAITVSAAYHYTPSEIEAAGLKGVIEDALKERDRLIGEAHYRLREFGIKRAEIEELVAQKMKAMPKP